MAGREIWVELLRGAGGALAAGLSLERLLALVPAEGDLAVEPIVPGYRATWIVEGEEVIGEGRATYAGALRAATLELLGADPPAETPQERVVRAAVAVAHEDQIDGVVRNPTWAELLDAVAELRRRSC